MHAILTVFLDDPSDREELEERMRPYDENLEVATREEACWHCNQPDSEQAECQFCEGVGKVPVHWNKNGKWDYYLPIDDPRARWQDWVAASDNPTNALLVPEGGWFDDCELVAGDHGSAHLVDDPDWPDRYRRIYEIAEMTGMKPLIVDYHS